MNNSEKEKAMTHKKDPSQHSDDNAPRSSGASRSGENGKLVGDGGHSSETVSSSNAHGEKPKSKKESNSPREDKKNGSKSRENGSSEKTIRNNLREIRIEQMMSKAELARKAGLSVLTIDRIEKGYGCRMDTKRKILKALGLKLSDRRKVFKED